ncbi:potassium-transporting ATPase subunit F [Paenibacillus marchantiophytorum]|nr:potassium-transporting ATPase subunit F [Paenibacillus marchantiophytorum]
MRKSLNAGLPFRQLANKRLGGYQMIVIGCIAAAIMVYLGFVLVKPEKF